MKKTIAIVLFVVAVAIFVGAKAIAAVSRHTVESRITAILKKKPHLKEAAKISGGKLRILVFKNERRVEVHAPGWKTPREYAMTAFSGRLGPKLREGDRQIPEGVYGIEYLNPNSRFYLSLKVSYPSAADKARAKKDGRTKLGGDIMIHGKAVTIGCVPVGDDAIEDIFYLASAVGIKNVSVIIAPYDMRKGRKPELERSPIKWYPILCNEIHTALGVKF
jgi:murein L,D-transpeptidase YafK